MVTFRLEGQAERLAAHQPFATLEHRLLYHQWRTYEALEQAHLVVNTYNTGTGKTVASLLQLFRLNERRHASHVLFIAPTNALIGQHAADIREFVAHNGLDFVVAEVNAAQLRQMAKTRNGETLYRLITNPLTYYDSLGVEATDYRKRPLILVVNPDIFYYALYFRYQRHDQRNVFRQIAGGFEYVVIDEFHYYNSKQLANFLFYFLLMQQMGRFAGGQRICLLSATPPETVKGFLSTVFAEQWALIAPDNEPAEAQCLEMIPTLTPLEVTVEMKELQEWVADEAQGLQAALAAGEHGAIISSTLWRISESHALLERCLGKPQLGRITGAEPERMRQQATARPLILATPTVDIGYNFKKYNKPRQNIDYLACDARFADEMVQRIGRAGRVLGKTVTDKVSRATLTLPPEYGEKFLALDGQTLSRQQFAQWLQNDSGLPIKHDLGGYIRSYAIMECFYPIWQIDKLLPPTMKDEMDLLFERVCKVFAPQKKQKKPWGFYSRYIKRDQWLKRIKKGQLLEKNKATAQMAADWMAWTYALPYEERYEVSDVMDDFDKILNSKESCAKLRSFVEGQVALTLSLFAFRDSFQGPTAAIYDPAQLLSSQSFNRYDLFHLLAYYELAMLDEQAFRRLGEGAEIEGDCYVRLLGFREPKLTLELLYEPDGDENTFKKQYCRCPIALKGFQLLARERGGDRFPLPADVKALLANHYIVALIIPPADTAAMFARLRGSSFYPRRLEVRFDDGSRNQEYYILLGTAAWLGEAELRGHFYWKERVECDAIIL